MGSQLRFLSRSNLSCKWCMLCFMEIWKQLSAWLKPLSMKTSSKCDKCFLSLGGAERTKVIKTVYIYIYIFICVHTCSLFLSRSYIYTACENLAGIKEIRLFHIFHQLFEWKINLISEYNKWLKKRILAWLRLYININCHHCK